MNPRVSIIPVVLFSWLTTTAVTLQAFPAESRDITLSQSLQIPGAVLKPGKYTFSVEDRLKDRAITRITGDTGNKHYLVLTVPSDKLSGQAENGLIFFKSKHDKRVLRGWICPQCSAGLEFVYPKLEAAKITDESTESVLAVDPESDKLPSKLSADDMKVVTLWLLSPERITASAKGKGVKAEKYTGTLTSASSAAVQTPPPTDVPAVQPPSSASAAVTPTPATAVTETAPAPQRTGTTEIAGTATPASQAQPKRRLPKTASSTFSMALWGSISMIAWAGLRFIPRRRSGGQQI